MPYSGPIKPGTSTTTFRKTGKSVSYSSPYQGPVRPGDDVDIFRETGRTVPKRGGTPVSGGGGRNQGSSGGSDTSQTIPKIEEPTNEIKEFPSGTAIKEGTYAPSKSYTPKWYEQPGFGSKFKDIVYDLGDSASYYGSLGGKLDYKPDVSPDLTPYVTEQAPGILSGGTAVYRQPTEEEMNPEQRLRYKEYEAGGLAYIELSGKASALREKYEGEIISGGLSYEEAQTQFDKDFSSASKPIYEKYEQKIGKAQEQYGADILKASIPLSFGKGAVFGVISALAPPVGLTLVGAELGKASFEASDIVAGFKTYPKQSIANLGAGLVGAGIGAGVTGAIAPKVTGYFRTIGKEYARPEDIIDPRVLSGSKNFPTAPTYKHLDLFKSSPYKLSTDEPLGVWHATPSPFGKEPIASKGSSELPGLYTAPSLSPHFLKIGGGYKLFGLGMESALGKSPTALRIYPKDIIKGYPKKSSPGYAFVPGMKTEIEAIIPEGTKLFKIDSPYYSTYKGTNFPIVKYGVLGEGEQPLGGAKPVSLKDLQKSYSYSTKPTSLITPSSFAKALTGSYSYPKSSLVSGFGSFSYGPRTSRKRSSGSGRGGYSPRGYGASSYLSDVGSYLGGSSSSVVTPMKMSPIAPPFGKFDLRLGFEERPTKKRLPKRKFKRRISLVSAELNLKAPKINPTEITGLTARRIITKKRKRK